VRDGQASRSALRFSRSGDLQEVLLMSRVLIVDDDILLLTTLEAMLLDEGFEVVAVDGGRKALTALQSELFDVVLVDMVMPGMDGFQTIRECRRINPAMPIIAMTGVLLRGSTGDQPNFAAMAATLSGMRILHKPFDQTTLGNALRAATRGAGEAPRSGPSPGA
jgi:DNA-binding response OmpR family regulator